jgi:hypothetical protein
MFCSKIKQAHLLIATACSVEKKKQALLLTGTACSIEKKKKQALLLTSEVLYIIKIDCTKFI